MIKAHSQFRQKPIRTLSVAFGVLVCLSLAYPASAVTLRSVKTSRATKAIWTVDGSSVFVAADKSVRRYGSEMDATASDNLLSMSGHISALASNIDATIMAATGWDGRLQVFNPGGREIAGMTVSKIASTSTFKITNALDINYKGDLIVAGDCQGEVSLLRFDGNSISKVWTNSDADKCYDVVTFDPAETRIISGNDDGRIRIHDIATGQVVWSKKIHGKGVSDLKFNTTGTKLYTSGKDGKIIQWSYPDIKQENEIGNHDKPVTCLALTPDDRFLVSAGNEERITFYDIQLDSIVERLTLPDRDRTTSMDITRDGRRLAFTSANRAAVFDLTSLDPIAAVVEQPPDLKTTFEFTDAATFDPNGMLDAAETEAYIRTTVANQGDGPAFGVEVALSCDNPSVILSQQKKYIGPMMDGTSQVLEWPVAVAADAANSIATFEVKTLESQLRHGRPVIVQIEVAALRQPRLAVAGMTINDANIGAASGNGNGLIDNGETIEVNYFISNTGVGRAKSVIAKFEFDSQPGLTTLRTENHLGHIDPQGANKKATAVISLSPQFRGSDIRYRLIVEDARSIDVMPVIAEVLQVNHQNPILAADFNIPNQVENDRFYSISINPRNVGSMTARGVRLNVTSPSPQIEISGGDRHIGDILPSGAAGNSNIQLSLPREYNRSEVILNVSLVQELDFAAYDTSIVIPVDVRTPRLQINTIDLATSHTIQQGERRTLSLSVRNTGNLDAKEVNLNISVPGRPYIRVEPAKLNIGSIAANAESTPATSEIHVMTGENTGIFQINLVATQDQYEPVHKSLEYTIVSAKADTIVIAADLPDIQAPVVGPQPSRPTSLDISMKPELSDRSVYSSTTELGRIVVHSNYGISEFSITVNGMKQWDQNTKEIREYLDDFDRKQLRLSSPTISLQPGTNLVEVKVVETGTGKVMVEQCRITYQRRQERLAWTAPDGSERVSDIDVDISNYTAAEMNPARCAIVIGIEDYKRGPNAVFAEHDAETFARYAHYLLGVPEENLFTFFDEEADYFRLRGLFREGSKINNFLTRYRNQAEVFFYYAGHGVPNYKRGDSGGAAAFLLPQNVSPVHEDASDADLSVDKIVSYLRSFQPKMIVASIDACFMGVDRNNAPLSSERPALARTPNGLYGENEAAFFASSSSQAAGAYPQKYHGRFTYFFLKGLRGEADMLANNDGKVTVGELKQYLIAKVPEVVDSGNQMPQVTTGNEDLVLAKLRK